MSLMVEAAVICHFPSERDNDRSREQPKAFSKIQPSLQDFLCRQAYIYKDWSKQGPTAQYLST